MYPSDKAAEVGKRYLEALNKYPPDEDLGTQVIPAAVKATPLGIRVIGISEVKEGKLEEAYTRTVSMMLSILAKISDDPNIQKKISDSSSGTVFWDFAEWTVSAHIYSVRYDMKRLKSLLNKRKKRGIVYLINPAFWKGLEISAQ